VTCHQNAGQNYNIKVANRSFENVAKFRYLETAITSQNYNYEDSTIGECLPWLSSDSLPSHLLSINVKIHMYKTAVLPVVLYWCEIYLSH
jgi:hypothetical protein